MELIVGKTAGFCYGVRNAVDQTYKELKKNDKNLYCLGELVHNEKIINDITEAGIITVDNIEEVPDNSNVIIRAHGVSLEVYKIAEQKKLKLIDLTCPKVSKVHELAKKLSEDEYYIILIAEKKHPETIGTIGFCGEKFSVIETKEEIDDKLESFKKSNLNKIAIIAQTTFSVEKFENIVKIIKEKTNCEVEVKNTICNATSMRQAETEELSKKVDLMIIIGGKNSANTRRLYDISCKNCKDAILIQGKNDEDLKEKMKNKYETIGIMAGASTPQESINEVVECISEILND